MTTLFHCKALTKALSKGHTLTKCIVLGQKGFKGWTSKMSQSDVEPDFLQETYYPNYFTLIEAELKV